MSEDKKYERCTLGWVRKQQKINAKKDGFDNVDDWLKWKTDSNILGRKYGKEFEEWVKKNKGKVPDNIRIFQKYEWTNKLGDLEILLYDKQ